MYYITDSELSSFTSAASATNQNFAASAFSVFVTTVVTLLTVSIQNVYVFAGFIAATILSAYLTAHFTVHAVQARKAHERSIKEIQSGGVIVVNPART